ncbi:hypothetical protein C9J21_20630 [Photobacterium phosphoreum]|uniref:hypothetical protein n=1 Tax=Photobacterium phosphoreum TaxID=659 RepID=UPI000D177983|nr:hypothetical protein [Photobacterium phosphoreum]PSW28402.1 hypothetical protein C9J21_20630 [Photobacterium phosphoreum]
MLASLRINTFSDLNDWVQSIANKTETDVSEHQISLIHGEFSDGNIGYMVTLTHISNSVQNMLITDGLASQIIQKVQTKDQANILH